MARLGENRYGKSRVRLSRITRVKDSLRLTGTSSTSGLCDVMLDGDFEASYTKADNSKVLPTDTMKNTVYFVARNSKARDHRRVCDGTRRLFSRQQSAGHEGEHRGARRKRGSG